MAKMKVSELNALYQEGQAVDAELFAEMRTNALLVSGLHYTKRGTRFWNRIRNYQKLTGDFKLRLTKNHIQKITKTIANNILTNAPGVMVSPKNPNELADKKAAELSNAVWEDLKIRQNFKDKNHQWVQDFVDLGECICKVSWNNSKGDFLGYEQAVDPDTGDLVYDVNEAGDPVPVASKKPVFSGDLELERIYGFNLLRAPEAKSFDECEWFCYRKMVSVKELKKMFAGDDEESQRKQGYIQESQDDTYIVFDAVEGQYASSKGQVMVREWFFRPSPKYPKGYFYITTQAGILHEGELPDGEFPLVVCSWDNIPTTPRGRSIVKQLRPYQVEINRCASKIAETQVTLGDDKLLIQSGSKLTQGGTLPGIRAVGYTGVTPTVMAGRSGDQYVQTMEMNIREMYEIANVSDPFSNPDQKAPKGDAYTMLFAAMRDKKRYSLYAEKYERFIQQVCKKALKLLRFYYDESRIVPVVGRAEMVNISEFKNSRDMHYQIKLEPQTEDMETKMGRTLQFNQILQYAGQNLDQEGLGKLIRHMPYANVEGAFDDLTMDYDNATNDILSLDRGVYRPAKKLDNHEYVVKRLNHRMKQADYEHLPQMIKMLYEKKLAEHEQKLQEQVQAAQQAGAGFIPSGGAGVRMDYYVADGKGGSKRATVPQEAITWLLEKLAAQGSTQEMLERIPEQSQANLGNAMVQAQGAAGQQQQGQEGSPLELVR